MVVSMKIILRILFTLPFAVWICQTALQKLGADPAKSLNHKTGEMALYFIIANLIFGALTILLQKSKPSFFKYLQQQRRFVGVISFIFLIFHFAFYLLMEGFEAKAWTQIYTKTYLILGSIAWLVMLVLAVTSNDFSVKRLGGRRWKNLHRLVYLGAAIAFFHVISIEKADVVFYSSLGAALFTLEIFRWGVEYLRRRQARMAPIKS